MKAVRLNIFSAESNYLLTVNCGRNVIYRNYVSGNVTLRFCTVFRGIFVTMEKNGVKKSEYYKLGRCNLITTVFSVYQALRFFTLSDSFYGLPVESATLSFSKEIP